MFEFETVFGKLQILEVGDLFDCSVLTIESGKEISRYNDKKHKEIEVILEGKIVCGSKILKTGDVNIRDQVHHFTNASKSPVKILVIPIPPFLTKKGYSEKLEKNSILATPSTLV